MVRQFVHIGAYSMTSIASMVLADLPPFVMCQGQPAAARGMNLEGLRRKNYSAERISAVKAMHKALYREDLSLAAAIAKIEDLANSHPEALADVQLMTGFLTQVSAERGIVR